MGVKDSLYMMLGWVWPVIVIATSTSKCAWLNEQHEVLIGANRWALEHKKQSARIKLELVVNHSIL